MLAKLTRVKPNAMQCDFCETELTVNSGILGLGRDGESAVGHERCLPSSWYHVDFERLLKDGLDGPNGWATHLRRKVWFGLDSEMALLKAYDAVQTLAAPPVKHNLPAMRSVTASIPRRVPRPPDDPRNISTGTRTRVLERDGFRCRRCGCGPNDAPLVVDHIVPVAKGGSGALDNLQTLCRPCNAGKSDREPTPHDLGARA